MIIIISILAGVMIFFLILLVIAYMRKGRGNITSRMRTLSGEEAAPAQQPQKESKLVGGMLNLVKKLAPKIEKTQSASRMEELDLKLQRANLPILGSEFLALIAISSAITFGYAVLLTLEILPALIAAAAIVLSAILYVNIRVATRKKRFLNQLGDTLSMTANAMRAGFSFTQAIELISREMDDPMGTEFGRVIKDLQIGISLENALEGMAKRVDSRDFDLLVTAVLIQRQVGGSLADILDSISGTISDRIRLRREVMTLTAQGRYSGYVLSCLPAAIGIALWHNAPDIFNPILTTFWGHVAIGIAVVLVLVGYFVMQWIVDIKL